MSTQINTLASKEWKEYVVLVRLIIFRMFVLYLHVFMTFVCKLCASMGRRMNGAMPLCVRISEVVSNTTTSNAACSN